MYLRGKRVLLTGDSHMDWSAFGNRLESALKEAGAQVTRLAIGATYAEQWLGSKDLCRPLMYGQTWRGVSYDKNKKNLKCINPAELATSGPYDLLVISTMGNDASYGAQNWKKHGPDVYVERVKKIAGLVRAPNFLLVGSPTYKPSVDGKSYPYIEAAAAAFGNNFYDSKPVTAPYQSIKGETDGVHYLREGGRAWAEDVVRWIQSNNLTVPFPIAGVEPQEPTAPSIVVPEGSLDDGGSVIPALVLGGALIVLAYVYSRKKGK